MRDRDLTNLATCELRAGDVVRCVEDACNDELSLDGLYVVTRIPDDDGWPVVRPFHSAREIDSGLLGGEFCRSRFVLVRPAGGFVAGDRVRVLKGLGCGALKEGREYDVLDVGDGVGKRYLGFVQIAPAPDGGIDWMPNRFELVRAAKRIWRNDYEEKPTAVPSIPSSSYPVAVVRDDPPPPFVAGLGPVAVQLKCGRCGGQGLVVTAPGTHDDVGSGGLDWDPSGRVRRHLTNGARTDVGWRCSGCGATADVNVHVEAVSG